MKVRTALLPDEETGKPLTSSKISCDGCGRITRYLSGKVLKHYLPSLVTLAVLELLTCIVQIS